MESARIWRGTLAGRRQPGGTGDLAFDPRRSRRPLPVRWADARSGSEPERCLLGGSRDSCTETQSGFLDPFGSLGWLVVGSRGRCPVQVGAAPAPLRLE